MRRPLTARRVSSCSLLIVALINATVRCPHKHRRTNLAAVPSFRRRRRRRLSSNSRRTDDDVDDEVGDDDDDESASQCLLLLLLNLWRTQPVSRTEFAATGEGFARRRSRANILGRRLRRRCRRSRRAQSGPRGGGPAPTLPERLSAGPTANAAPLLQTHRHTGSLDDVRDCQVVARQLCVTNDDDDDEIARSEVRLYPLKSTLGALLGQTMSKMSERRFGMEWS